MDTQTVFDSLVLAYDYDETSRTIKPPKHSDKQGRLYVGISNELLTTELPTNECDLIAKAFYQLASKVGASNDMEWQAGMQEEHTLNQRERSEAWAAELTTNIVQIWLHDWTLPDLTKISKSHLKQAEAAIFAEASKGLLSGNASIERYKQLLAYHTQIRNEIETKRKG